MERFGHTFNLTLKPGGLHLTIADKATGYIIFPKLEEAFHLCLWEAIKFASTVTNKFDFEGSMIESVEKYFRSFGAVQKPYFTITKTPSFLLRLKKVSLLLKGP